MFNIKQNDTSPILAKELLDALQQQIPLTGSETVVFSMRVAGPDVTAMKINRRPSSIQLPNIVIHTWQAGDTNTPGHYWGEFEVTYGDGTIETFPNSGYLDILIDPQLA